MPHFRPGRAYFYEYCYEIKHRNYVLITFIAYKYSNTTMNLCKQIQIKSAAGSCWSLNGLAALESWRGLIRASETGVYIPKSMMQYDAILHHRIPGIPDESFNSWNFWMSHSIPGIPG